jgi:CheY-like chemotaxis protein/anti-sigma regulatory factor (Ser/Thr protein kinase)
MTTVLVVNDLAADRLLAGALVKEEPGWQVVFASDGREALAVLRDSVPDLILTDLQMPEVNGLELLEAVHRDYPCVPVILMTAHGSEERAVSALQKGAAGYVLRCNLARDLLPALRRVLRATQSEREQQHVPARLQETENRFVLGNDISTLPSLVLYLQEQTRHWTLLDRSDVIRVGTALYEVLLNAIEHGNLEVSSQLREGPDSAAYKNLVLQRRLQSPYRDRHVFVTVRFSKREACFVVRDEGPGFDPSRLPDPSDPANLEKASGRGLVLVRMFLDEVRFNATGNDITLFKRPR